MESKPVSQLCLLFKKKTAIRLEIINTNKKTYSQKASQEPARSHRRVLKQIPKNTGATSCYQIQHCRAEESLR